MSLAAQLNRRVTRIAVGQHLPRRAVRVRLTLLYGALFLLSGAALMAIAYALLVNAGFVFTTPDSGGSGPSGGRTVHLAGTHPSLGATAGAASPVGGFPQPGSTTHPTAGALAHWGAVARCIGQHGVTGFPSPTTSFPVPSGAIAEVSDRDGVIFVIPAATQSEPAYPKAIVTCGFAAASSQPTPEDHRQHDRVERELLLQSGIALAGMSLLSLALGWLVAGRVLQPLEDSYLAQRQFVANASHELRTPLARQRALIQVALADPEANLSSLRAAHERVLASEQQLEQMIDALLTLTRSQAGVERRERLDLAALAAQVLHARESEAAARGLEVRTSLGSAPALGDPRLIERLIANLIENAIRHNTSGGEVLISTGVRDRHAVVSIANTGPAVPPEEIQRLFEPFQRLGGARTRHDPGHGLGLSIVHAIATAHGAQLTTRPRPQGGLAIEVSFPPATDARSHLTLPAAWTKHRNPRASLQD